MLTFIRIALSLCERVLPLWCCRCVFAVRLKPYEGKVGECYLKDSPIVGTSGFNALRSNVETTCWLRPNNGGLRGLACVKTWHHQPCARTLSTPVAACLSHSFRQRFGCLCCVIAAGSVVGSACSVHQITHHLPLAAMLRTPTGERTDTVLVACSGCCKSSCAH